MEPNGTSDDLVHNVLEAALEVHGHPRPALDESVYEAGLCHEPSLRDAVGSR